jgi:cobalt/nickel transport protein
MKTFFTNKFLLTGILISLVIAGLVSYYASSDPDGLEKVAEDKGFLETARDSANSGTPLADYGVVGVTNERLSVGLSGVIGVFVTLLVAGFLFRMLAKKGK